MQLRTILAVLAIWLTVPLPPAHANPKAGEPLISNVVWARISDGSRCLALQQVGQWLLTNPPHQYALDDAAQRVRQRIVANISLTPSQPASRTPRRAARTATPPTAPTPAAPTPTIPSMPWLLVYADDDDPETCPAQLRE